MEPEVKGILISNAAGSSWGYIELSLSTQRILRNIDVSCCWNCLGLLGATKESLWEPRIWGYGYLNLLRLPGATWDYLGLPGVPLMLLLGTRDSEDTCV